VELALRHVYALATSDGVKHELLLAPDTSDIPSSADTKQLRDALTAARLALRTSVIAIAASQPAQMSRLQRMPVVRAATPLAPPYPVLPVAPLRPATDCDCECEPLRCDHGCGRWCWTTPFARARWDRSEDTHSRCVAEAAADAMCSGSVCGLAT
jgi:hypothetical protein